MKFSACLNACLFALIASAGLSAQVVFSSLLQDGSTAVFQQAQPGGAVTRVATGFAEMNYSSLSRNGRFVTFSSPDPTGSVNQFLPSSDIYIHDRLTGVTNRILDQQTDVLPGQAGPETFTLLPESNALSPDGSLVVFSNRVTRRTGTADPQRSNNLILVPTNGSGASVLVEQGNGESFDFLHSEFVGMSWTPDGNSFATSAYITVFPGDPTAPPAQGIVRYTRNGVGQFVRSAALSSPRLASTPQGISAGIQIFPAYSPSGAALAYFDVSFPDSALLQAPATARLIVANADGSGAVERVVFNPGFYPLGVAWAADGSQLVFSIANQVQGGGQFPAAANPATAVIRAVAPFSAGPVTSLAGIDLGFLPNLPAVVTSPAVDLSEIALRLSRTQDAGFLLSAAGLDPSASYLLESSTTLEGFSNATSFTGAQIMAGITVPYETRKFFRLRNP